MTQVWGTSHLLPRNYSAKTSLSRQQLIFSQELQPDLLKHKNITWAAQSCRVQALEYPYGPQISGATPTCPHQISKLFLAQTKSGACSQAKAQMGICCLRSFCLLLEGRSASTTPAGTEQRAAWRVGQYRKLSHMSPFSKSNKLSIFSRERLETCGYMWYPGRKVRLHLTFL